MGRKDGFKAGIRGLASVLNQVREYRHDLKELEDWIAIDREKLELEQDRETGSPI